jgi:hypothetical protein
MAEDLQPTQVTGPHGWLNWYAETVGHPRREAPHPDSIVIRPIWEEFALYTDAAIRGGDLELGPFEFLEIDHVPASAVGHVRKLLLLRSWDHLPDSPPTRSELRADVEHYFGGNIGDELAALLGLALGRRFRSGGSVRQGLPIETLPLGHPSEMTHRVPALEPPHRQAMISTLAEPTSVADAVDLLRTYPSLPSRDAVALVRSAQQYVDGLWLADADPRLAWLKLIGALEAAAGRRDDSREDSPIEQLKRHKRQLYRQLKDGPPEALQAVAVEFARVFHPERKLRSFVRAFDPGPPAKRPAGIGWHFDWESLDQALGVIYNHRSRDLHDGIPFPWLLCAPPQIAEDGVPAECFPALGWSGHGGQWTSAELPMYLHTFAHAVGGALRGWWASLAPPE